MTRLLVRDLEQLATPAVGEAPLRGPRLGAVEVLERAFVLTDEHGRDRRGGAHGRPRARSTDDVEELDGRGLCVVPGLVDCHTHACFGGDRVEEFALRAAGASYEELHAAGGGIRSTVAATRAAGEDGLRDAVERHRDWMLRAGTTTWEAKSGYGLDRETELASLRVIRAAGGIPTWLGAHAVPPEFDDADAYLDFALAEVLPEAARPGRGRRRLPRARRLRRRAGAPLPRGVPRGGAGAPPPRRPVHGGGRDSARDRARRALGRPPRGDRPRGRGGPRGERRRGGAPAGERALPRSADAAGACARRRGRRCRARDRLQSRARRSARACRSSARSRRPSSTSRRLRRSPPAP